MSMTTNGTQFELFGSGLKYTPEHRQAMVTSLPSATVDLDSAVTAASAAKPGRENKRPSPSTTNIRPMVGNAASPPKRRKKEAFASKPTCKVKGKVLYDGTRNRKVYVCVANIRRMLG